MNFYRKVVNSVPAYQKEVENHKLINVIDEIKALAQLPILTKSNYLLEYSQEELCWPDQNDKIHFIGSSSGFSKSGIVYWTKRPEDELDYMEAIEKMLRENYQIDHKKNIDILLYGSWVMDWWYDDNINPACFSNERKEQYYDCYSWFKLKGSC